GSTDRFADGGKVGAKSSAGRAFASVPSGQLRFQVVGTGNRVVVVGRDLLEAKRRVQLPRGFHVVEGVEQHRRVAAAARLVEQRLGDNAADAEAAKRRPHIEPLHFAGVG